MPGDLTGETVPQPAIDVSALARASGGFAMVALDQRESMRAMFAERQPDNQPVPDERLTEFKLAATRVLSPHASAVLLDRQFALDQALDTGAAGPGCAVIAAADRLLPRGDELVGATELDDELDAGHYRQLGAAALKLLVIYRPDEDPAGRISLVERFVDRCRHAGLVSIVEPVSRAPVAGGDWDWDEGVLAAARELGRLGADLYKAEVPMRGRGDPDEIRRRCAAITTAVDCPWVVLSSGVAAETFPEMVRLACAEGAAGFLAGRGIWQTVIQNWAPGDDLETGLREIALPRLRRLAELVETVVGSSKPSTAGPA